MLGRYTPLVKIAAGGMATVFAGLDKQGALVALKRPHEHLIDDAPFLRSLRVEVELGELLVHPNVVGIQRVERQDDALYLVMTYVDGVTLGELVRATADDGIPLRVAVRILLDSCVGLGFAHDLCDSAGHRLGIVHRDVSPANILVGTDGVSRVSDFGIAKAVEQADATTTTGIKGKVAYMAPEYVRGRSLDQRSDVFALGIVAWEILSGRRLFRGSNDGETIERVLNMAAPALRDVDPLLAPFDEVLAHALTKDPEERFVNANAFRVAFEAVARHGDAIGDAEEVGELVRRVAGAHLAKRHAAIESAYKVAMRTTATDTLPLRRIAIAPPKSDGDAPPLVDDAPVTPPTSRAAVTPSAEQGSASQDLAWRASSVEHPSPSSRPARARWLPLAAIAAIGIAGSAVAYRAWRAAPPSTDTTNLASAPLPTRSSDDHITPAPSSLAVASASASATTATSATVPTIAVAQLPVVHPATSATAHPSIKPDAGAARVEVHDAGGGWRPAAASDVYGEAGSRRPF